MPQGGPAFPQVLGGCSQQTAQGVVCSNGLAGLVGAPDGHKGDVLLWR